MDEAESRGRFKVSVSNTTPAPESTSVGRFRLIPQGGSPFLQRGRFSVIPEEETGSPQTKLTGPKIVIEAQEPEEWDFNVSTFIFIKSNKLSLQIYCLRKIESFCLKSFSWKCGNYRIVHKYNLQTKQKTNKCFALLNEFTIDRLLHLE